MLYKMQR